MNGCACAVNNPDCPRRTFACGDRGFGTRSDSRRNLQADDETTLDNGTSVKTSRCERSSFKDQPEMKLSFGSAIALTLCATVAQTQVLPNPSGRGSSAPLTPGDRSLVSRPFYYPLSATGLTAGMPGPYLPNPNDPTRLSPTFPTSGVSPPLFVGE